MEKFEQKQDKTKIGGMTMFKSMKKQLKNEKGLTLIELLAVIVILAIIAAIAIPAIGNIITNSKYNAVKSDAINIINAAQLYYLDNPEGEEELDGTIKDNTKTQITVAQLIQEKYLDNPGHFPKDGPAYVKMGTPSKLTSGEIKYSGERKVTFKDATVEGINGNSDKGSKKDDITINN